MFHRSNAFEPGPTTQTHVCYKRHYGCTHIHFCMDAIDQSAKDFKIPLQQQSINFIGHGHLVRNKYLSKTYGPYKFFLTMLAQDNIAPRSGVHRLKTFFMNQVDKLQKDSIKANEVINHK